VLTLSYGYKKPQTNDKGSDVFPALEDDITRLNGHTHNGTDSAILSTSATNSTSQSILAAAWSLVANGIYKQVVTMPAGLSFDNTIKEFRLSNSENVYPTTKKTGANTYEVYINDNTETLTVYYK
jgi:hypothetical protein